jgi:hypothetical protein
VPMNSTLPPAELPAMSCLLVLIRHRLWAMLHGSALYLLSAVMLLLLAVMSNDFAAFIGSQRVVVSKEPLEQPLLICLILAAVFLSLYAAVGVSREREQGTMMVLHFGPVDPFRYLTSWLIALWLGYLFFVLLMAAGLVLISRLSGIAFSPFLGILLLSSLPAAVGVFGFGLLAAALGHDSRRALLLFLGLTLLLAGFEGLNMIFASLEPAALTGALAPLSRSVSFLNGLLTWLSPYGYLPRILNAAAAQDWRQYALGSAGSVIYGALMLMLSMLHLERFGVCP